MRFINFLLNGQKNKICQYNENQLIKEITKNMKFKCKVSIIKEYIIIINL